MTVVIPVYLFRLIAGQTGRMLRVRQGKNGLELNITARRALRRIKATGFRAYELYDNFQGGKYVEFLDGPLTGHCTWFRAEDLEAM